MKQKLRLSDIATKILAMINDGDDFVVNEYDFAGITGLPITKEDTFPRVCDFVKAGYDKEIAAYYFAYLIAMPGYEVISLKSNTALQTEVKPTFKERHTAEIIEDECWGKAMACRKQRIEEEKNEQKL